MPTIVAPEATFVLPKALFERVVWSKPILKVVYIAGAFRAKTQWGIVQNVRKAEDASLKLWKLGYAVICPHTMTQHFQNECPDEVWLKGCIELLKRSDAIYLLEGWGKSEGSREELKIAEELGLVVLGDRNAAIPDIEVTCPECGCFYKKVSYDQNKCPRCNHKEV